MFPMCEKNEIQTPVAVNKVLLAHGQDGDLALSEAIWSPASENESKTEACGLGLVSTPSLNTNGQPSITGCLRKSCNMKRKNLQMKTDPISHHSHRMGDDHAATSPPL